MVELFVTNAYMTNKVSFVSLWFSIVRRQVRMCADYRCRWWLDTLCILNMETDVMIILDSMRFIPAPALEG